MKRRELLRALAVLPFMAASCSRRERKSMTTQMRTKQNKADAKMPVIFAAHGAPILLDDAGWMGELASWAKAMPRPASVLMVSAHWEERPTTLGATRTVPLVYDFYGFPQQYYQTKYPAPGAPELAARVRDLLGQKNIAVTDEPTRGLDHGAYVPLVAMYPHADVPVLQISMPGLDARELFELGRALSPLRDEGVLVFGSGFLTHNMRYAFRPGIPQWAQEFDAWVEGALSRFDVDALVDFQTRAPSARMALPTWEHYAPVLIAAGAAAEERPRVTFPITGWWMEGAFTRRSVQFGA
jgi:4,5-DOPA dioxygenase extradiol